VIHKPAKPISSSLPRNTTFVAFKISKTASDERDRHAAALPQAMTLSGYQTYDFTVV
jgi:hypothetical protein